jgi:hypothetical protein
MSETKQRNPCCQHSDKLQTLDQSNELVDRTTTSSFLLLTALVKNRVDGRKKEFRNDIDASLECNLRLVIRSAHGGGGRLQLSVLILGCSCSDFVMCA